MRLTEEQVENIDNEIAALLKEFTDMGLPFAVAKKAAIKVIRRNIDELDMIDGVHMIGLKPRMDLLRQKILMIIEK